MLKENTHPSHFQVGWSLSALSQGHPPASETEIFFWLMPEQVCSASLTLSQFACCFTFG